MGLLALGVLGLVVWHGLVERELGRGQARQGVLVQALAGLAGEPSRLPERGIDYAQRLPATADATLLVRQAQRSAATLGVGLVSVSLGGKEATAQALGRVDLAMTLRGDYPSLKRVLAELVQRHGGLVLQRLSLRRLGAPNDAEARADFTLLTRPLPAPVSVAMATGAAVAGAAVADAAR